MQNSPHAKAAEAASATNILEKRNLTLLFWRIETSQLSKGIVRTGATGDALGYVLYSPASGQWRDCHNKQEYNHILRGLSALSRSNNTGQCEGLNAWNGQQAGTTLFLYSSGSCRSPTNKRNINMPEQKIKTYVLDAKAEKDNSLLEDFPNDEIAVQKKAGWTIKTISTAIGCISGKSMHFITVLYEK